MPRLDDARRGGGNDMQHAVSARTPVHLWIVGFLSLLWNCFGAFDYLMTKLRGAEYIKSTMPGVDSNAAMAWINGMPLYAHIGWGLGVWAGLLGAILLLLRSRHSVWAFAISIVGMAMSFGGQYLSAPPPAAMETGMAKYMPVFIVLIGLFQAWYAWRETKAGVLR